MTTSATGLRRAGSAPPRSISTTAPAALAVAGGGLLVAGVLLPWLTVYAGLDSVRGIDGLNGRILLGAGLTVIVAGVACAVRPAPSLRWGIGAAGFATSGFAAWVVSQLLGTYHSLQAEPFFLPGLGTGAFIAMSGALLVLGTLLLPHHTRTSSTPAAHVATPPLSPSARTHRRGDVRDILRAGIVASLLGAAMIHFTVIGPHLQESSLYAAFFIATGAAQAGFALLLAARPQRAALVAAAAANSAFIAAWVVTRTVGLPFGPNPGVAEDVSLPDVLASVQETAVVVLAVLLAARVARWRPVRRVVAHGAVVAVSVGSAAVTVVAVVAALGGAG